MVWKWKWAETQDSVSMPDHEVVTENDSCSESLSSDVESISDSDNDEKFAVTHKVIFKCIGCTREPQYQNVLAEVAGMIMQGATVPVRVKKEPSNPFDSRAIAFECQLNCKWERIGYVVCEATEAVHEAIDQGGLQVSFDWVKYIVYFSNHGWYAGIAMTKQGQWPASVLKCKAKSYL